MNSNYPVLTSSQLTAAPWNEKENTPIKVDCCVSCCMSKSMPVEINNYNASDDNNRFSDTNFIEEFNVDSNAYSLLDLLVELHNLSEEMINRLEDELTLSHTPKAKAAIEKELKHYKAVSDASQDWMVDDFEVMKEE